MTKLEVVAYNKAWPRMFEQLASDIMEALNGNVIEIYHVGSTSVPGLIAKPKIDIIAVARDQPSTIEALATIGYVYKGEYNIPFEYFFAKRGDVNVNLHLYKENHPEIELNIVFRDYLRKHEDSRAEYAALKVGLLQQEASFKKEDGIFHGYNLGKDVFIRSVLEKSGFNRVRFLKCTHHAEWDAAKKLLPEYFSNDFPFHNKDYTHFILCQAMKVIGYAHVSLKPEKNNLPGVKKIVVDNSVKNANLRQQFIDLIHKWIRQQ